MPVFDYRCLHCGHEWEYLLLSRDEIVKCPKCGRSLLKKLLPKKTAFILKGSGWAKDGYK